jgi:hypothetical protein
LPDHSSGSIYKIIAKTLVNRLKMGLEKIVSKGQNAFILGRQILDPIPIANKCFDSRLRSGKPEVICKMNLEKLMIMLIGICGCIC